MSYGNHLKGCASATDTDDITVKYLIDLENKEACEQIIMGELDSSGKPPNTAESKYYVIWLK